MTHRPLIERTIDAGNRFAAEELVEIYTPDIVVDFSRSAGPARGVYRGEHEVRRFFESYMDAFESVVAEPVDWYECGAWVAVEMQVRFRGRGSGVDVDARGARVYEVRGGKVVRQVQFQNFADARQYVDAQQGSTGSRAGSGAT